jgi:hypothetical protein
MVFQEMRHFFAENLLKWPKIVIITLAPRIITKTGMQNLLQHSVVSMAPTAKNGSNVLSQPPQPTRPAAGEQVGRFRSYDGCIYNYNARYNVSQSKCVSYKIGITTLQNIYLSLPNAAS